MWTRRTAPITASCPTKDRLIRITDWRPTSRPGCRFISQAGRTIKSASSGTIAAASAMPFFGKENHIAKVAWRGHNPAFLAGPGPSSCGLRSFSARPHATYLSRWKAAEGTRRQLWGINSSDLSQVESVSFHRFCAGRLTAVELALAIVHEIGNNFSRR